jgi:hypothetical protein
MLSVSPPQALEQIPPRSIYPYNARFLHEARGSTGASRLILKDFLSA